MAERVRIRGEWRDKPDFNRLAHALLLLAVSQAEEPAELPAEEKSVGESESSEQPT